MSVVEWWKKSDLFPLMFCSSDPLECEHDWGIIDFNCECKKCGMFLWEWDQNEAFIKAEKARLIHG